MQTCAELVESLKFCNTECSLEEAGFDTAENEPPEVSAKFKNPGIRGGRETRNPAIGYGPRQCPYWDKSNSKSAYDERCPNGVRCPYAHGAKEQQV